ncbi:MAG: hypothetical protein P8J20_09210 [Novosphingobium sp.]|nr:hypothetical protein [Novosphingobium sp.]
MPWQVPPEGLGDAKGIVIETIAANFAGDSNARWHSWSPRSFSAI